MKALHIVTDKQWVSEIELDPPTLEAAYQLLLIDKGSRLVEAIPLDRLGIIGMGRDCLLVDEEGWLPHSLASQRLGAFELGVCIEPFAGRGLIVGMDDKGEWAVPNLKIEQLRAMVRFLFAIKVL